MSGSLTSGGEMSNGQLFQQIALLRWLTSQTEEDRQLLTAVTGVQIAKEVLNRITSQDQVDAYKTECILGISQFIKDNPRATQAQINEELEKRVLVFAARVHALEKAPLL